MAEREIRRQRQERREEGRLRQEQIKGRQRWQQGLVAAGVALVVAASGGYGIYHFFKPYQPESTDAVTLSSPGTETPTQVKEKLSQAEKNIITEAILKTSNYSETKLAQIENLIKAGSEKSQIFELETGDSIYVKFLGLSQIQGTDLSGTDVTLTFPQTDQERVAEIQFKHYVGERIGKSFPESTVNNLVRREATAAYMQMIAITQLFKLKGIDLSNPLDSQMVRLGLNDQKIQSLMKDLLEVIEPYSVSIPQLEEAFGLMLIADRSSTGTIRFVPIPDALGNIVLSTTIGGVFYPDNGKLYLGLNLLGPTISQTSSIADLQRNYSSIRDIPGWSIYHNQLSGHSRTIAPKT